MHNYCEPVIFRICRAHVDEELLQRRLAIGLALWHREPKDVFNEDDVGIQFDNACDCQRGQICVGMARSSTAEPSRSCCTVWTARNTGDEYVNSLCCSCTALTELVVCTYAPHTVVAKDLSHVEEMVERLFVAMRTHPLNASLLEIA